MLAATLAERLRDEVLVGERDDRDPHAGEPADLRRVHATGVDYDLGLDVAPLGFHAAHAPAADVDAGHPGVREDLDAAFARTVGERVGQLRRVQVAVGDR